MKSLLAALTLVILSSASASPETREFRLITVELSGTKIWLPSTLVVKKGDTVKINAKSLVPGANSVHGLKIEAFKVEQVATAAGVDFTFVADRAGIYPLTCHLHPAHIGAQLIVQE